jgi:hypothetical protein
LREKAAQSAPDEGYLHERLRGERPLTRLRVSRSHPLPQGERVRGLREKSTAFEQ